jgi:hypothetical protein
MQIFSAGDNILNWRPSLAAVALGKFLVQKQLS